MSEMQPEPEASSDGDRSWTADPQTQDPDEDRSVEAVIQRTADHDAGTPRTDLAEAVRRPRAGGQRATGTVRRRAAPSWHCPVTGITVP